MHIEIKNDTTKSYYMTADCNNECNVPLGSVHSISDEKLATSLIKESLLKLTAEPDK